MKFIGLALVFVCTFGGLLIAMKFDIVGFTKLMIVILNALPGEFVIIFGVGVAAFIIANPSEVLSGTIKYMGALSAPAAYDKEDYIELLSMMFSVFKLARTKGWLALEPHIENADESDLFKEFPIFHENEHAVTFLCDYLRIISLGNEDPNQIKALIDEEIGTMSHHEMAPGKAVGVLADGLPALGIVAAVLGVIKTMASINEPPEILGKMIGSALVGTFLGVWLSYSMVGPISEAMKVKAETKIMYYKCMRVSLLTFLQGAAPQVAVEFARKFLPIEIQPDFNELEEKLNELPTPNA